MDRTHGVDDGRSDDPADAGVDDAMFDLGGDERRMHVRAYNHWVSLLKGRAYPSIEDLDPASIVDFGAHSVLLDFSATLEDPRIAFLGKALREECGLDGTAGSIADVPSRSLLSRLTDHYLQIIANRAPIGFEAEFVGTRGLTTLYRGILMPFSSTGETIDFIYGVINWKEVVDAATQATLAAELDAAVRNPGPALASDAPVWADSPSGGFAATPALPAPARPAHAEPAPEPVLELSPAAAPEAALEPAPETTAEPVLTGSLGDWLMVARESAAAVRAADTRSRAALYRALGRAHDFALAADDDADGYARILADAAIPVQARAPMTPVVKLVFGADYDKTRLAEFAAVLGHARRQAVETGGLIDFLEDFAGGIKAVVAAERAAKRPASVPDVYACAAAELRALPVLGTLPIDAGTDEFVVLVARAAADGTIEIVKRIEGRSFVEGVVRRSAA